jgi:hypothetical protein
LRGLSNVGPDPPRLVAGEQLGRRTSARLRLEIDVGKRLPRGFCCRMVSHGIVEEVNRAARRFIARERPRPPGVRATVL